MPPRGLIGAASLVGVLAVGHAGVTRSEPPRAQEAMFSARADLVVLHLMVTDRQGEYVPGLTAADISIVEDHARQTIQFFAGEDAPVTVGLLVDRSGSMAANRDRVVAAAGAFVETSNPADEIFALVFHERVASVLPAEAPFTSNAATLRLALIPALSGRGGRTALHDALVAGLEYLRSGRHLRRVLVVVSDGGDNASVATFDDASRDAMASNAAIYTISVVDPLNREANPGRLKELARLTGGEAFAPRDITSVGGVLQRIAAHIRHTYTVAYASTNSARDGRVRQVRVAVRAPGRGGLHVRTRRAYLADGR